MKKALAFFLLLLIYHTHYGQQHPAVSDPRYNPTVPRLLMMNHKVNSRDSQSLKPVVFDFEKKISREDIDIYTVYEMDSTVGTTQGNAELFNPPKKLMDIYLIYEYNFLIYCQSKDSVNARIPGIDLNDSRGFVESVKIVNHFIDGKGRQKNNRIKKSGYNAIIKENVFLLNIDEGQLLNNSFTEVTVKIKSRNFNRIVPSFSSISASGKSLTFSYPLIFNYETIKNEDVLLVNEFFSTFELLHFRRNTGPGNGNIDRVITDSRMFVWEINPDKAVEIEFELNGISIPQGMDIGISASEIIGIK